MVFINPGARCKCMERKPCIDWFRGSTLDTKTVSTKQERFAGKVTTIHGYFSKGDEKVVAAFYRYSKDPPGARMVVVSPRTNVKACLESRLHVVPEGKTSEAAFDSFVKRKGVSTTETKTFR